MPEQLISDEKMKAAKVFVNQVLKVARMEVAAERASLRSLLARQEGRVRAELRKATSPQTRPPLVRDNQFSFDALLTMTDEEMKTFQRLLEQVRSSSIAAAHRDAIEIDEFDAGLDETFVFIHAHRQAE
jgi:hypothetical protein